MTNEQRMKITDMRSQGCGYSTIAKAVGLSKDSVKAFCRSHGLAGVKAELNSPEAPALNDTCCLNCGASLTHIPGAKRKKFCSPVCRQAWWNAHQQEVKRKAIYQYICPSCGKPFSAYGNSGRKYCSHACYIAYRYAGRDVR
ncbi:MAG TPA: RNA polymerase subunit sigma-70 [Clostridia bacterium]|nr:RNA polymerase subunit sigma-70 [Clostridia bacterium]HUM61991.1 RNA polymerase subunit sigma-70 [Clostridia bacterium]